MLIFSAKNNMAAPMIIKQVSHALHKIVLNQWMESCVWDYSQQAKMNRAILRR